MTYKTEVVEKEFLSEEAQANISSKMDFKSKKDALKDELTANITDLEEEKEYIMGCASKFGSYLKENALIPYNDAFKEYIDMLIHDEKHKPEHLRSWNQIRKLEEDKQIYEEKKKVLDESLKGCPENDIKKEDIFCMRDLLIKLKHNGKPLKDALGKNLFLLYHYH